MDRFRAAASRYAAFLLALACGAASARFIELAAGLHAARSGAAPTIALAAGLDLLALARAASPLFLLLLPALLWLRGRAQLAALGIAGSLLLLAQVVLMQYALTTGVPLGADLYAYSLREIGQAGGAGAKVGALALLHLGLPVAVLWAALLKLGWQSRPSVALGLLAAGVVALAVGPAQAVIVDRAGVDALALDKAAFFVEDSLGRMRTSAAAVAEGEPALDGFERSDATHPFLHPERTPDVLGPLFNDAPAPPNLVLVIVEGLGRSFSGPDAALGSFTPFLDELGAHSLYFENFLSNQGRTFAALPTLLGSLPFADTGFAEMRQPFPAHDTLPGLLKGQGYRTQFYAGFDLDFDSERPFLAAQGVETVVDLRSFGPGYTRDEAGNSWGYADRELVARALAGLAPSAEPYMAVIQTVTMHTPYTFPGQADWGARLEHRLDELGIEEARRAPYRESAGIYESILYADDALRALVEGLRQTPAWPRTVLIVTGDHRLPELPMATRIERYHVPLIIHSPLLKAPARIKAVSSQMDLAPSLLAWLSHHYTLATPAQVTWLGDGLDLDPRFGNRHAIPLKMVKAGLDDFVQGASYLSRGQLFKLGERLGEEPAQDPAALARLSAALARFAAANAQLARSGELRPARAAGAGLTAYRDEDRAHPQAAPEPLAPLAVTAVRSPARAATGTLAVEADFANRDPQSSVTFVPLAVLLAQDGSEVSETYGAPLTLHPGEGASVKLAVKSAVPPGHYLLAVIPSDPDTGKAVGAGWYHIEVQLE